MVMKELGAPYGLVVEAIEAGSPAEKAGIVAGDVITNINGLPVHTGADLVNPIAQTPIGQSVQVRFVHNKVAKDANLIVADRSKIFPQSAQANDAQPDEEEDAGQLGLHVEELTPELARKLGMGKMTGVLVTEVDPASFAEEIDFGRGYVINEINHAPINGINDYKAQMGKLKPGDPVLFKVSTRGDNDKVLTLFLAGASAGHDREISRARGSQYRFGDQYQRAVDRGRGICHTEGARNHASRTQLALDATARRNGPDFCLGRRTDGEIRGRAVRFQHPQTQKVVAQAHAARAFSEGSDGRPDQRDSVSLARGGYYQGATNGKWDSNTVGALQKFQSDNNLNPSGKLDASSLQKLGLGSSTAGLNAPTPPQRNTPAGTSTIAPVKTQSTAAVNSASNSATPQPR